MWISAFIPVFILFSGFPFGILPSDAVVCRHGFTHLPSTEMCIKVYTSAKTWDKARYRCHRSATDLITIHDMTIFNGLKDTSLVPSRGTYWIGLNDKKTEGKYVWLNENTQASFHNLNLHPNYSRHASDQDCIVLMTSGSYQWFMQSCHSKMQFICAHQG